MSHTQALLRRTGRIAVLTTALSLALAGGFASTASANGTSGDVTSPQPISKADANHGGANGQCPLGAYCSTRDGSASLNGSGTGKATGKPCAGCVGKADNKNPKGQMPNGSDKNAGYECDRNNGIGKGNPAHTSCTPPKTPVTPPGTPGTPGTPVTPGTPGTPGTPTVNVLGVTATAVTPATTPVVASSVLGVVAEAPVGVLGVVAEATNPLPAAAAAGEADTNGQLAVGGFAAFAALLAFGARFVLRRRHGVV